MLLTTAHGRKIDLMKISASDINIQDIAHGLSNLCRFAGHTRQFYSVAQHSVRVALSLPPEWALSGLLHDATEAYVVDLPRPVKVLLPEYLILESRVWRAIAHRYKLDLQEPSIVKTADNRALRTEWEELMPGPMPPGFAALRPIRSESPEPPDVARRRFLRVFDQLAGPLMAYQEGLR